MIKVKHMGRGDMRPPAHFLRDLKLIDPNFSVVWEPIGQRYAIIRPAPVSVFRKGYVSEYLVETTNKGYASLDGRVIRDLRYLMWEKNGMVSLDHYPKEQKKRESEKIEKVNRQTEAKLREAGKKCDKFRTTKTFT